MATRWDDRPLNMLGVSEIAEGIHNGAFQAQDVVRCCLSRIADRDAEIGAWVETDDEGAIAQAVKAGRNDGPLVGVPFGVKDVLETARLRTRMGSSLYEQYHAPFDAGCVAQLRLAGGIVLGKTTTCEFAGTQPTATANPHNTAHTPGGSSSGSAAAVADFMVPLAWGTQTGGSVMRPAAFCGIVGFKPTYGFYPIAGMKPAAHSFDTPGLLARSAGDIALVHSVLMNEDIAPPPSAPPRIGLFRSHLWETMEASAAQAFERAILRLEAQGARLVEIETPQGFERITERRAVINAFERARGLAGEWMDGRDQMGPLTRNVCDRGFAVTGSEYAAARRDVEKFSASAPDMFRSVDYIVTPVTPGEAPSGLENTGDPRLQELWTMLHMPSIGVPAGTGRMGLPLGLQIVGPRFEDAQLIAQAGWIERSLAA